MKAVVLHGARDLRVDTVPEPSAFGPKELLLRCLTCGICGTDVHEYGDGPSIATTTPHPLTGALLPQILGHEFSAEVLATGPDVTTAQVGDRVAIMPLFFCGECVSCRTGQQQVCAKLGAVGLNWPWGGMAEYAVVAEHQVARLPEGLSDEQGALVEPTAVAVQAVNRGSVQPGDCVLVTGGGPIGQLVALAASAAGAGAVFLSEPNPARRERAARLDVAELIDPMRADPGESIQAATGDGADIAIECSGSGPALEACIAAVRPGGVIVQTGLHSKALEFNPRTLTLRNISLLGVNCFPVTSWPKVIRLMASGRLPAERIVTGRVDVSDAVVAFDGLLDPAGDGVKVLVAAT